MKSERKGIRPMKKKRGKGQRKDIRGATEETGRRENFK